MDWSTVRTAPLPSSPGLTHRFTVGRQLRPSLILLVGLLLASPAAAQIEVEGFLGSSVSAPSPLWIIQRGQPDLHLTGHWATRPFRPTWYYAGRIGLWRGTRGWLLDFTHHKMTLIDRPSTIQQFALTNGVNILTVSRGFRRGHFSWALGAGPTFTFPVNRVRGEALERGRGRGFFGGYFLSGVTAMASATRHFPLVFGSFLSLDGRVSTSFLQVPVADGHATIPNLALHLHAGVGYGLPR